MTSLMAKQEQVGEQQQALYCYLLQVPSFWTAVRFSFAQLVFALVVQID